MVVLLVSRKGAPLSSEPPVPKSETVKLDDTEALSGATMPETEEKAISYEEQTHEASALEADLSENFSGDEAGFDETMPEVTPLEGMKKEKEKDIAVSSEMKAVMDALTHRERSIIEALIKHGGRTTQAEIRYETSLPRSSLTMVLVSLERRNLITKKEWGRTNVIELSESFFSKKEQS